jgi:hypothetical protein
MATGGFDLVLMNPPYIQHGDIGKLPSQDPKTYKSEIAQDAQELTHDKFVPNKQSDISVYFHVRSLSLLREGGVAVVIATNKWLDTRYGVPLQEYFLRSTSLDCIYDSARRSFAADVNTAITVIRKTEKRMDNLVRFVYFNIPISQVTGDQVREITSQEKEGIIFKDSFRFTLRTQAHLLEDGINEEPEQPSTSIVGNSHLEEVGIKIEGTTKSEYVGTKWGNLHLKAPPVYYAVLSQSNSRLVPLSSACLTRRGSTSGVVDYFILRKLESKGKVLRCENGFGHTFDLEEEFAPAVLRDPEEITTYSLRSVDLPLRLFRCPVERSKLKGKNALRYIQWGETSNDAKTKIIRGKDKGKLFQVSDVSTVAARSEWYQLPEIPASRLFLPKIVKNRHVIPLSDTKIYSTDNFYPVYSDNPEDLWLYLNSSIFRLFMELNGRSEGAGALQIMVYEYKQCPVPSPLPQLSKSFEKLQEFKSRIAYRFVNISESGPLEFEQDDRRVLDNLVLEAMGFSDQNVREETLSQIYAWLRKRVEERLLKAKSGPESVSSGEGEDQTDLREFE